MTTISISQRKTGKSDYITSILPSFNMQYKSELWDLSSDYTLNWWYYWKLKQGKDSHNLNLASQVRADKKLFLSRYLRYLFKCCSEPEKTINGYQSRDQQV